MTIVALETSTRAPSVAVRKRPGKSVERVLGGRSHASDLLPALDELLRAQGSAAAEIRAVCVGVGPGSYTGLRVGIATAQGLVRGSGANLIAVPSSEVLVYAALEPGEEGVVLADARQGELYFARYRRLPSDVEAVVAPRVITPQDLRGELPARLPIFGHVGVVAAAGLNGEEASRVVTDRGPRAIDLLELGEARLEAGRSSRPADVQPLYLRAFRAIARKR